MKSDRLSILTINGGSSSIKFSLYEVEASLLQMVHGAVEDIGSKNASLHFANSSTDIKDSISINSDSYDGAADFLIEWLQNQEGFEFVKAIGHRVVHGMKHTKPEIITSELLSELKAIIAYDPEHLPGEIKMMEFFQKRYPSISQIACFDTAFHTSMPPVATWLSIPRKYKALGVQRYGFHGLSYTYLLEELERTAGKEASGGRIILAHLGNGSSLAAVKDGKSMDTSMGFTPASGLVMGTRTGDLDPGVAAFVMQTDSLTPQEFTHLINHQSGLLGISEISSDMRELLKCESTDSRAAEAIELFCYQTKKWIGSFAAVLGGLDTLIFSGGIGEHNAAIRERICHGLQFLGILIDTTRNVNNESIISVDGSTVTTRVIPTNEELMIARSVCNVLNYSIKN